ncbi:DUF2190 family protein [Aureliella helgolandensis]|uniref:Bacteriophage lambda head decoration protein D n=1 Tax=Aureliella helgolandensis TaxID=2527968 RepID=A0A518G4C5_9BACT|nr:DUF2190 family protein [Aureliella helgolandensis]QDV23435.1 hypothetical protein Q31a_17330 [Aureliella helgolandensis]
MSEIKYLNSGEYFKGVTPSGGLVSGNIVFDAMNRAGVITAQSGFVEGQTYTAQAVGRVEAPAKASDEWIAGALVYWDASNKEATDTVGSNKIMGRADVAKVADETTNVVLLNSPGPSFVDTNT